MSENENGREANLKMVSSTGGPPIRKKKEDRQTRGSFSVVAFGPLVSLTSFLAMCRSPSIASLTADAASSIDKGIFVA